MSIEKLLEVLKSLLIDIIQAKRGGASEEDVLMLAEERIASLRAKKKLNK